MLPKQSTSKTGKIPFVNSAEKERIFASINSLMTFLEQDLNDALSTKAKGSLEHLIFQTMTNRKYCSLTKKQAKLYEKDTLIKISRFLDKQSPLKFLIDFCGGYHASIWPKKPDELTYSVGLGELYLLYQIKMLHAELSKIYCTGSEFELLIDDGVANYANGISFEKTSRYTKSFREVISHYKMGSYVKLLVETEEFNWESVVKKIEKNRKYIPTKSEVIKQKEIISRFLGKKCCIEEARMRLERYVDAINVSDKLINTLCSDAIRMKQRTSNENLCFRSFPGGNIRIQCGQVGYVCNNKGKIIPTLITANSSKKYEIVEMDTSSLSGKCNVPIYFAKATKGSCVI